jgi:hypothetical protein
VLTPAPAGEEVVELDFAELEQMIDQEMSSEEGLDPEDDD